MQLQAKSRTGDCGNSELNSLCASPILSYFFVSQTDALDVSGSTVTTRLLGSIQLDVKVSSPASRQTVACQLSRGNTAQALPTHSNVRAQHQARAAQPFWQQDRLSSCCRKESFISAVVPHIDSGRGYFSKSSLPPSALYLGNDMAQQGYPIYSSFEIGIQVCP